ncbi:MAG: ferrochelatase [Vicinamibacterales bacterium]
MSFDAVLVIAFGGPEGPDDVRPFLGNVLRGRRVPPERIEEVAHHYELFGGVSPLAEITRRQAEALGARLAGAGVPIPVYVGMRNWHPFLADTLAEMSAAGVRRAIGFIMAPHGSYASCGQYKENVRDARLALRDRGLPDVAVTYMGSWYAHPLFIAANAAHVRAALARLGQRLAERAQLVFTAHSIPLPAAERSRYREQLQESSRLVAAAVGRTDWTVVYQSRSGRPEDAWLEPDVCDHLRAARARGLDAAVLCPIGFVCDHIEVLYDLDVEAAQVAKERGLGFVRAEAANDDPLFVQMMAAEVLTLVERHRRGRPLPLVANESPATLAPARSHR